MKNIIELPAGFNGNNVVIQTYNVYAYQPSCELKQFCAYVYGEYVYPARGYYNEMSNMVGIYIAIPMSGGEPKHIIINPVTDEDKQIYSIDCIIELSPINIDKLINEDKIKSQNYDMLVSEGETFKPTIFDKDNVPQRVIKKAICDKNIDFKVYTHKFRSPSDYSNHKRSIQQFKLSWEKFQLLCDVLDLDWTLIIEDKEGCPNPMGDIITISSIE